MYDIVFDGVIDDNHTHTMNNGKDACSDDGDDKYYKRRRDEIVVILGAATVF